MDVQPYWMSSALSLAPSVRAMSVGHRFVVFCGRTQALIELNDTAKIIWQALAGGLSCTAVIASLHAEGVPADEARAFVVAAAAEWLQRGYLLPTDLLAYRNGKPACELRLSVDGVAFDLRLFGPDDWSDAIGVFAHFAATGAPGDARIDVLAQGGFHFLFFRGEFQGMCAPWQTPPRIKAIITGEYARVLPSGFLAHGALLSSKGRRVLLSGEPGAGKTTLSLALANSGFAYGGDDIVRTNPDGTMYGVPFAAAAKPGSWPLLEPYVRELSLMPIFERDGGVLTKYILPAPTDALSSLPTNLIFFLARSESGAARVTPVTPLDALQRILDSGWSERHSIAPDAIEALAGALARASAYQLVFSGLSDAVELVQQCVQADLQSNDTAE